MEQIQFTDFNLMIVILSMIASLVASYAAFDLLSRVNEGMIRYRGLWLVVSSFILGVGIWTVHYIGMLSINHSTFIEYRLLKVLLALFAGNILVFIAFLIQAKENQSRYAFIQSGLISTIGIGVVHMIGMASIHIDYSISFSINGLLFAFFIAFVLSSLAFKEFRSGQSEEWIYPKLKSGLWMGAAIVGLHYTAMYSVLIEQVPSGREPYSFPIINSTMMGIGIMMMIIMFEIIVIIITSLNRKISRQSEKLQMNEQYYKALFNQNPDTILTFDLQGRFLTANHSFTASFGYTLEEMGNQSFTPFLAPRVVDKTLEQFTKASKGLITSFESVIFDKNGIERDVNITKIPLYVNGEIVGIYDIIKDITQHKKAEKKLAEADSKYKSLVENSLVGVYIIQKNEKLVYANPRLCEMVGYKEEELIRLKLSDIVLPDDLFLVTQSIRNRSSDGQKTSSTTYKLRAITKDKRIITLEVYGSNIDYAGETAVIGTVIDITERQKFEETIKHMAYHDHLTHLPNRMMFFEELENQMNTMEASSTLAILYIDLDRFKIINDTLGHEIGDKAIIEIVNRLKACIGNKDFLARYGGDEFALLMAHFGKEEGVAAASRILEVCNKPIRIEHYEVTVTSSIGISNYSGGNETPDTLIKQADTAMYTAKKQGANQYVIFTETMIAQTKYVEKLELDLRRAINQDEFILHYQPQMSLETNKIIGIEALIRWNHPVEGLVSPASFIPIAEESGLIIPIGEWVLRRACQQMKHFQVEGGPPIPVSVNISPKQFYQSNLVELIKSILMETELESSYLELEITESITMDVERAISTLNELRNLGVKISIDDFGTGYSSLNYLSKLPIDKLKIDQSFIRNMTDSTDETIVKAIISMGQNLHLKIIAEGVEKEEHVRFLKKQGCDEAQGYYFSKPISFLELRESWGKVP
jgi:diguanylate cyclase (GGDEF)-like protein/PAS domain S-box-containing protein